MSDLQYWAANTPSDAVSECMSKTESYYQYINQTGYKLMWTLVWIYQHSAMERQALSTAVGEYGELQQVRVNDFRNFLMHKAGIIKNQMATWEPMAVNDDVTSLAQTTVAKNILEMYTQHKDYNKKFDLLVNYCVAYGEAFALQTWDATKGKKTHVLPHPTDLDENGKPLQVTFYEGDVDCRIYEPIHVIRDPYVENVDQNKWYIFKDRKNKWDLPLQSILNFTTRL